MTLKQRALRLPPHKISQKLILSFTVIMLVVTVISSYVHVKTQEQQLLDAMMLGADQLSGSISSATWHAMLADQRDAAYQTMETIAQKQGITRIRIFNKEGRIMYSTMRSDTGVVDKAAEACFMCHAAEQPVVKVDVPTRARVYHTAEGLRTLSMITPIYNEPSCTVAECHAHPESQSVLGVLDVSMSLDMVDAEMAQLQVRVIIISLSVMAVVSLFTMVFTKYIIDRPIRQLIAGTHAVSEMQLDRPIVIESSEELGELAHSFDVMRIRLKEALDEINEFTEGLERKVRERTDQLKVAHQKLLHSDRLASLGQLSASVAHEINNPVSGVLNLAMLMQRIMKEDGVPKERVEEFRKYLAQVVHETSRVGRIVQDLLAFSRRSKPSRAKIDFNAVIRTTVSLLDHKLKLSGVRMELLLGEHLPPVHCDSSQMQQVVINLVMNAAEAAQGKPDGAVTVTTRTGEHDRQVLFIVADNGDGITEENLQRIFSPFFTTKGEGKGVGLGLAVVFGIVEAHKGDIDVKSELGVGTVFTVTLPADEAVPDGPDDIEAGTAAA
ncbi:MAG: HAMP domain-containing protein [Bacteroidetes bacterium]|nr:MAG: HAMP domain-containing protein [Bacteroidota bacterium]